MNDNDMIQTDTARNIDMADEKAAYDNAAKLILSDKNIVAFIASYVVDSFKGRNFKEIKPFIPGYIKYSREPVNQDEKVRMENTEDNSTNEGVIRFDVKFLMMSTNDPEDYDSVVDYEMQRIADEKYPLDKRAIYYYSRLISKENKTIMKDNDYSMLRPAYSVWFIKDGKYQNHIEELSFKRKVTYGKIGTEDDDPEMGKIIFVYLGEPEEDKDTLLSFADTLFSSEISAADKKKYLQAKGIQMTKKVTGGLKGMSGFGGSIAANERNKGKAEGINEGLNLAYFQYIGVKINNKFSTNQIVRALMEDFGISESEAKDYVTKYNK